MKDSIKVGLKAALDYVNWYKNSLTWRNFVKKRNFSCHKRERIF
jgi:hypothetical protein